MKTNVYLIGILGTFFLILLYAVIPFYNNIHTVISGTVYRSGQLSSKRLETFINENDIKGIINLRGQRVNNDWYQSEKQVTKRRGIPHFDFEFKAHELPDYTQVNHLVRLVENIEKPYLVHCWRGAERAGFASALILALEKDLPLKKLKEQFSLRYGVLFPKNSIGGLFFNEYEKWLGSVHKLHSGKRLSAFIQDHYVDSTGNMKFYIDSASGVVFDSNKKAVIKKVPKKISIGGWAIDAKQFIVVEDLFLKIDGRKKVKVIYKTKRPDVIKFLGLADHKKYPEKVGWEAVLNSSDVPQGCQKLYFEFDYHGIRRIDFFTGFELCIE